MKVRLVPLGLSVRVAMLVCVTMSVVSTMGVLVTDSVSPWCFECMRASWGREHNAVKG